MENGCNKTLKLSMIILYLIIFFYELELRVISAWGSLQPDQISSDESSVVVFGYEPLLFLI